MALTPALLVLARRATHSHAVCPRTVLLVKRALQPWTPATHMLFGPKVRKTVFQVLLVRQRLDKMQNGRLPSIPTEVWERIIDMLGRGLDADSLPVLTHL
jgi:hypothetical protein